MSMTWEMMITFRAFALLFCVSFENKIADIPKPDRKAAMDSATVSLPFGKNWKTTWMAYV